MSDCYFDELASQFAKKIYGKTKGAIRLAVIKQDLSPILSEHPLRILDIGAGLGHISLWLAEQGHQVTVTEPSPIMLEQAKLQFQEAGISAEFIEQPWQQLAFDEPFDLVICHAVLEWLEAPFSILPTLKRLTKPTGYLSLAFYNKDALIYYNLLKSNFRKLKKQHFTGDKNSLTPKNPIAPLELQQHMTEQWNISLQSGIRVFYDYMPLEFKRIPSEADIIEMELNYCKHPTFSGLGRYIHWLCQPK